jgi:thiaminase/transcriptional activator TenA
VPVAELLPRAAAWERATRHPFVLTVGDGTLPGAAFDTWLVQDARFVTDLLAFQARLLARAPRPAAAVLAGGLVALVEELDWFDAQAAARGLDLAAPPRPATVAYAELLGRLDAAPAGDALLALYAVERVYLEAWTAAAPGAEPYRPFVEHWTTPGFAGYVEGLAAAADAVGPAGDPAAVVDEVLAAEVAFWDTAVAAG